jgi:hypothetical protein
MEAVLTGDIIHSRNAKPALWIKELKRVLQNYGDEPKAWEIYRGDSFQLLNKPANALETAVIIKATIKKIENLDVRIAIGIGEVTYKAAKITQSNGSAFVNSGSCFDQLKKQTLAIKSPWQEFDYEFNNILALASLVMDKWTAATSEIIIEKLHRPEITQAELAAKLKKKSQGTISEGLKRGGYDEIKNTIDFYKYKIRELCGS